MTLAAALSEVGIRPVARLAFLADLDTETAAFTYDGQGKLLGGSVTMDRLLDAHRTGSVSVVNDDGLFTPGETTLVSPYRLVRLSRGALVNGVPVYEDLLTGLVIEPKDAAGSARVEFAVWSRLHLADQQFEAPAVFEAGTRLRDVTRTLCELSGLGTNDAWFVFDDDGATLATPRTFDVSDTILRSMVTLAHDHGCELFDDGYGRIVLRPWADPLTQPIAWEFPFEAGSRLTGHRRTYRRRGKVYNRVRVIGIGPDRYPIMAEARDLNPLSPTYNPPDGSGPLGDRPAPPYVSADIHTQLAANLVAARRLAEAALTEIVAESESIPLPGLEARSVVSFDGTRHLLDRITLPLTTGAMTLTSRQVYALGAES